jgi:hypothetical protein
MTSWKNLYGKNLLVTIPLLTLGGLILGYLIMTSRTTGESAYTARAVTPRFVVGAALSILGIFLVSVFVQFVAHEIAHALLFHTLASDSDPVRARPWDRTAEEEAQWLGGALLVSDEAALALARAGTDTVSGAARYGVSTDMLTYRLNVTGAIIRASRSRGPTAAR